MPRYHLINFGCRANQADGASLEQRLAARGFTSAQSIADADVVVLNSCTVTASADYGLRQAARRARRMNPSARVLVTGCYAQRSPEDLASLAEIDWVVGNSHKSEIARLLFEQCSPRATDSQFVRLDTLSAVGPAALRETSGSNAGGSTAEVSHSTSGAAAKILRGDIFVHHELLAAPVFGSGAAGERTRPNLKVQDGCNNRCSFCVIPYVRGRSRSLPLESVVEQVRALALAGYKEIVLSGINLGRWGRDFNGRRLRLSQLVRSILEQTPITRLRLSSVEPMDFTDELLDLMAASPRIAKHIHAPLQSGSECILRRMHRKYHPDNYRDRIEAAYARMPNAAFGADVMVGFPGETAADFEETRSLIDSLPFTYLHVFPFSRRPGTPADNMPQQVNGAAVRERSRILRSLAAQKNRRFRERQVGGVLEVVTLSEPRAPVSSAAEESASGSEVVRNATVALSDNFLDVLLPGVQLPANRLIRVMVTGLSEEGLIGEPAEVLHNETTSHVAERPDASLAPATPCPSIITSAIA
jgi:threonylcarbamoyladenosine tRNA methylthiotransferase MtaB